MKTTPLTLSPNDELITERRVGRRWNCSSKTLRHQRPKRQGCPYIVLGRLVRYRLSDVLAYETEREHLGAGGRGIR
jgi:hypothetical protein